MARGLLDYSDNTLQKDSLSCGNLSRSCSGRDSPRRESPRLQSQIEAITCCHAGKLEVCYLGTCMQAQPMDSVQHRLSL